MPLACHSLNIYLCVCVVSNAHYRTLQINRTSVQSEIFTKSRDWMSKTRCALHMLEISIKSKCTVARVTNRCHLSCADRTFIGADHATGLPVFCALFSPRGVEGNPFLRDHNRSLEITFQNRREHRWI